MVLAPIAMNTVDGKMNKCINDEEVGFAMSLQTITIKLKLPCFGHVLREDGL